MSAGGAASLQIRQRAEPLPYRTCQRGGTDAPQGTSRKYDCIVHDWSIE